MLWLRKNRDFDKTNNYSSSCSVMLTPSFLREATECLPGSCAHYPAFRRVARLPDRQTNLVFHGEIEGRERGLLSLEASVECLARDFPPLAYTTSLYVPAMMSWLANQQRRMVTKINKKEEKNGKKNHTHTHRGAWKADEELFSRRWFCGVKMLGNVARSHTHTVPTSLSRA